MPARLHRSRDAGKDSIPRVRAYAEGVRADSYAEGVRAGSPGCEATRGKKQPGENASKMKSTPEGLQPPLLRTPAGVRLIFNAPFPGCALRTTRGYPLPSLRDEILRRRSRATPLPTPEAFQPVAPGAKLPGERSYPGKTRRK
jgi:hypothetical protein